MQVVICDDDIGCCEEIKEWLEEYGKRESLDLDISLYFDAEELLDDMTDNRWFDVIFLDIELPKKNGVELGYKIREIAQNDTIYIVYISGKTEYCPDLFETEPLNFHHKPLKKDKIIKDMKKIVSRYNAGQQVLKYTEDGVTKGVFLRDIVYIRAKNKKTAVYTNKGTSFFVRESVQEIAKKLEKYHFYQCHRAYVINMKYVDRYLNYNFYMKDGTEINVSRKYNEDVRRAWVVYDEEG